MVTTPPAGPAIFVNAGNPPIRDRHTADPAPLVAGDRLHLCAGHDEARGEQMFNVTEWRACSTTDMQEWDNPGQIVRPNDFSWVSQHAGANQADEKNDRYWFCTAVGHDEAQGSHGVAVRMHEAGEVALTGRQLSTAPLPGGFGDKVQLRIVRERGEYRFYFAPIDGAWQPLASEHRSRFPVKFDPAELRTRIALHAFDGGEGPTGDFVQ